ncbi:MAG: L-aspartate oxidase [Desulfobacterales bacterium]|jgi:L-aspartate oxidase|nr:L-aspartate oxidase [Desulfobacterales bacterium]MDD3080817.1 L-aspartate oxidase [Desulfobacterales bacterium]MDD3950100.1 L-aspartate oxidase [Desulfobacterales bacterium]MDD4463388.1 L-aspartate oxidase [Desulfobacterales bacterium]MDY0376846.1 L-aspartate oxidase [Desulfobacterales bacterium]
MEIQSDFLVLGSGVAGLTFALKVAAYGTVALVTKKGIMDSNTSQAQGGVASVFGQLDSFDLHIQDTLAAGDGLCNLEVVEMVVKNGPDRILELINLGVNFNLSETSTEAPPELDLGREGGHSRKRIVHAQDMTGQEIERVLVEHVRRNNRITVYENHIAIDLITRSTRIKRGAVITTHEESCHGAYVQDRNTREVKTFCAKITMLATGGAGKVYLYTSNPDIATGDGIAMAYRAGATVSNLEFVQFHPTCLYHPEAKNFLISEAVRGEGAYLIDAAGHRFMEKYDPQKELACRDVVARAIDTELKKSGKDSVFLDISHKDADFIKTRFPNLYEKCLSFGIDMALEPIPVVPAAHYMCGGVATDTCGRTDIKRLYAIGETACTGLHGANRLASNSLAEALVYAHSAALQAVEDLKQISETSSPELSPWDDAGTSDSDELIMVAHNWDEIRRFMWNYVGIVRSNKRLERAKHRIESIQNEIRDYYWDFRIFSDLIELRNIATVAELIIKCAMQRKESRGLHYNIEYPYRDDKCWKQDTIMRRPFST